MNPVHGDGVGLSSFGADEGGQSFIHDGGFLAETTKGREDKRCKTAVFHLPGPFSISSFLCLFTLPIAFNLGQGGIAVASGVSVRYMSLHCVQYMSPHYVHST